MPRLATRRIYLSLATWLNNLLRAHARSLGVPRAALLRLLISDRRGAAVMGPVADPPAMSEPDRTALVPAASKSDRTAFYLTLPLADAAWLERTCLAAGGLTASAALSVLFLSWCGRNPLSLSEPAANRPAA